MTSIQRLATRNVRLAFAAALSLAVVTTVSAATSSPASSSPDIAAAQKPIEQVEELKEVWVRGKYTANMIVDVEDQFFKRYNKLNKTDDYDISCGYMSLERGSMIFYRRCVPEFIVRNTASYSYSPSYFPSTGASCMGGGGSISFMDYNGAPVYQAACSYSTYPAYSAYAGYSGPPVVPSRLLLMARGKAYADNVDAVIATDPQLIAMSTKLLAMYDEMEMAQKQYIKVRGVKKIKIKKTKS